MILEQSVQMARSLVKSVETFDVVLPELERFEKGGQQPEHNFRAGMIHQRCYDKVHSLNVATSLVIKCERA